MREPFIFLCREISRSDAYTVADWMNDEGVTRYLTDDESSAGEIIDMLARVQLPTVTHIFGVNGRFMLIRDREQNPLGFVRLVPDDANGAEIVVVVGERGRWGGGLGKAALTELLRLCFFELRLECIKARIHEKNCRSLALFRGAGFVPQGGGKLRVFNMTYTNYLNYQGRK